MLLLELRDGAVEMALAVADATAAPVERRQRDEERRRVDLRRIRPRLMHAESALDQRIARLPQPKAEMRVDDLRKRHLLPAGGERLHDRARIDLAADRPIGADRAGLFQLGEVEGPGSDALRRVGPEGLVERVAPGEVPAGEAFP